MCTYSSSSLLSDHPTLEPRHFIDERVVNEHHPDYMFLECIKFINEVGKLFTLQIITGSLSCVLFVEYYYSLVTEPFGKSIQL